MTKSEALSFVFGLAIFLLVIGVFLLIVHIATKPDHVYKHVTPVGTTDTCSYFEDEYLSEREHAYRKCGYTLKNCTSGKTYECVGISKVTKPIPVALMVKTNKECVIYNLTDRTTYYYDADYYGCEQ